eukprot:9470908-Pyramimonas_sp.AAC.1
MLHTCRHRYFGTLPTIPADPWPRIQHGSRSHQHMHGGVAPGDPAQAASAYAGDPDGDHGQRRSYPRRTPGHQ